MHGAANDFVVVDHRRTFLPETIEGLVRRLCDRRRGIGADGVLLIEGDSDADFAMRYFNADGGVADYCGNGARCVARLALDLGLGHSGEVRFRTAAGVQRARRRPEGAGIELEFGRIEMPGPALRVEACEREFTGRLVQAGVPHFVVPVERVEWAPVRQWGAALRHHARFEPEGANVDFVARLGPSRVAMRTYERGVEDETLACGSGAMATAVWAVIEGEGSPVVVMTAGGDELVVTAHDGTGGYQITLAGPAEIAFEGEWTEEVPARAGAR
jgi:diaminopimelate epimerase